MAQTILLFGGSGRTGLHIARQLCARGDQVVALNRAATDATALEDTGATVVTGSPLDQNDIEIGFAAGAFDAVICTLGHRRGEPPPRADLEGVKMIIDTAKELEIERVLMITMIGAGESISVVSDKVIEFLGVPIKAKTEAENYLRDSGLAWTILRPGGLNEAPESGTGELHEECVMGVISTAELARLTLDCLDNPGTIGKVYHTIDPAIKEQAPLQRGENMPPKRD
jgi:uncharacterized protein YbjT (DUF2867 family)